MKMNQLSKMAGIVFLVGVFSTMALAHDGGNPRKGKYLWKKNCKTCHSEGREGGKLSPSTKTQSEWNQFFQADHDGEMKEKCMKFSDGDLHDIRDYMYGHAMDSDQPETCG